MRSLISSLISSAFGHGFASLLAIDLVIPFSLFNKHLNAGQYIVHHYLGNRLYALTPTGLKINGAELIA